MSEEWSGSCDPDDPDSYWIDDKTGERVSAWTGERTPISDQYPLSDWQYEVANGDTRLGYEEWVRHRRESEDT